MRNSRARLVFWGLFVSLHSPSLWAIDAHELLGTWVIESPSPQGTIAEVIEFSEGQKGISGAWRSLANWSPLNSQVGEIAVHGTSLSFRQMLPNCFRGPDF